MSEEKERMIKVYIAGKYSAKLKGEREENVIAAMKVWWQLKDLGYIPFCPHLTHFLTFDNAQFEMTENRGKDFWYDYDNNWLKCCDALLVISESEGVKGEIKIAQKLGLTVFYSIEELNNAEKMSGIKHSDDYDLECERCGNGTNRLYKHYKARDGMTYLYEDSDASIPENEREEIWLCWDCDFEVTNGRGSMDDEPYEVQMDREEQAYEADPVNNLPPWL